MLCNTSQHWPLVGNRVELHSSVTCTLLERFYIMLLPTLIASQGITALKACHDIMNAVKYNE